MRSPVTAVVIGTATLALAACTADGIESNRTPALGADDRIIGQPAHASNGVVRHGDSFAMMSEQYTAGAGPYVATGASAWVRPAPAPAFVAAGAPPRADPPPPDPIEAAINQSIAEASAAARPEAAAVGAAAAADPALRTAGLALFNSYACGICHALTDAGASGSIGPALDRNPRLTRAFAIDVISHGAGAMPSFAGQMSEAEIAALADYLVAFARK